MVIYFPRTFSTSYNMIHAVRKYFKEKGQDIQCVVSHPDKSSLTLKAGDNALIEPSYVAEENDSFYINTCKTYKVDLIIPGETSLVYFKTNEAQFNALGIKLLISGSVELLQILRSKVQTYQFFETHQINVPIPKYKLVNTVQEFISACNYVSSEGSLACFKPDISQGASGFRIVDNTVTAYQLISGFPSHRASMDFYVQQFQQMDKMPSLIVTEYLADEEVTLDCLATNNDCLFYFPRIKDSYNRIVEDRDIFKPLLNSFIQKSSIQMLFNLQLKYHNGIPYLLEVNPRYSGGSYLAEENGYPMLAAAIDLLINGHSPEFKPLKAFNFKLIETYITY